MSEVIATEYTLLSLDSELLGWRESIDYAEIVLQNHRALWVQITQILSSL